VEFDPTPDNEPVEGDPEERPLPVLPDLPAENPARGYLWVEIPALDITLSVVHLKSSRGARGRRDADNASKREYVAGAVTANIAEAMRQMPRSYAHLVLGDLNVGHTDDSKNGRDLGDDCYSDCADRDGYDDTHALLRDGLISGVRMRNLATGQRRLIDAIYVTETAAGRFSPAETTGTGYGSDHAPLFTDLEMP
jgi:endonuclease/exonuclease/phosphatase family metal-dependent hydrolase